MQFLFLDSRWALQARHSELLLLKEFQRVLLLGASPALMQLTENLVAISFNTSLQMHGGDIAVASMSILTSVMQFVMLLLPGIVQGAQSLLSYNFGANNITRVKSTFRLLLVSCVGGKF